MKTNKQQKVCMWCGSDIIYDRSVNLWYSVKRASYVCTKDIDPERCEHMPESAR